MGRWKRILGLFVVAIPLLAFGAATVSADGGTMGKSSSNPDGNGADKPFASEGQGTVAAQAPASQGPAYFDGNNGCGQDRKHDVAPDFQGGYDDNNGHCGKPAEAGAQGARGAKVGAEVAAQAQAKIEVAAQKPQAAEQSAAAKGAVAAQGVVGPQAPAAVAAQAPAAVAAEGAVAPAAEGPAAVPALGGNPSSAGTPWQAWLLLLAAVVSSSSGLVVLLRRPLP